ncbi:hypothetical protein NC652_005730 [Populus alba x Populus x berolinensis]|nr:hypothetical protein NC652_005730 [Populus alba x Populus x berolinensis]
MEWWLLARIISRLDCEPFGSIPAENYKTQKSFSGAKAYPVIQFVLCHVREKWTSEERVFLCSYSSPSSSPLEVVCGHMGLHPGKGFLSAFFLPSWGPSTVTSFTKQMSTFLVNLISFFFLG